MFVQLSLMSQVAITITSIRKAVKGSSDVFFCYPRDGLFEEIHYSDGPGVKGVCGLDPEHGGVNDPVEIGLGSVNGCKDA